MILELIRRSSGFMVIAFSIIFMTLQINTTRQKRESNGECNGKHQLFVIGGNVRYDWMIECCGCFI